MNVSRRCTIRYCMGRFGIARSCAAFMGSMPIGIASKRCLSTVGNVSLDERFAGDGHVVKGGKRSGLIN